jgi:hypothetical protein
MPKYRVLVKSFIKNTILEPGEIVEYNGRPGSNLELIDEDQPKPEVKGKGKGSFFGPKGAGNAGADLV